MTLGKKLVRHPCEATGTLFESRSLKKLATGVLTQLVSILQVEDSAFYIQSSGFAASERDGEYVLYAGTGCYQGLIGQPLSAVVPADVVSTILDVDAKQESFYQNDTYVGFFKSRGDLKNILFLKEIGRAHV